MVKFVADKNVSPKQIENSGSFSRTNTQCLPLAMGNNIGYDLHSTQNGLYARYDAKIVGDYTGLTPPFGFDGDADDQF